MKLLLTVIAMICSVLSVGQTAWQWTSLPTMPKRTANNAVVAAEANGTKYIYSFGGIDSTKLYSGIHQESFRFNTSTQQWQQIPDIPDTLGKIAMGASEVNGVIYLMGGYHVLAGGGEVSSDRVHRFDPATNTWLSDGANIPLAIDDQVQVSYKDSLIYLITGWSNTSNRPNVQIYNTYTDSWITGTAVPNNNTFICFGASGEIIGDTIYYNGGVAGSFSFTNRPYLRKGVIDPNSPDQIVWTQETDNPGDAGYRMAAAKYGGRLFWIGGAGTAYNYDGVAYDGSGGVEPLTRILTYDAADSKWYDGSNAPIGIMDLRGIGQVSPTEWVICGGMDSSQVVSNRAFLLTYDPIIGSTGETGLPLVHVYPNPCQDYLEFGREGIHSFRIIDSQGRMIHSGRAANEGHIDVSELPAGSYTLEMMMIDDSRAISRFAKH